VKIPRSAAAQGVVGGVVDSALGHGVSPVRRARLLVGKFK
jgi:hypothetical protein